jgi:hypothetical protein
MEPNTKMFIEELMKQVQDKIIEGFATHMEVTTQRLMELAAVDLERADRVAGLEEATATFSVWKPEVETTLAYVKLGGIEAQLLLRPQHEEPGGTLGGNSLYWIGARLHPRGIRSYGIHRRWS